MLDHDDFNSSRIIRYMQRIWQNLEFQMKNFIPNAKVQGKNNLSKVQLRIVIEAQYSNCTLIHSMQLDIQVI